MSSSKTRADADRPEAGYEVGYKKPPKGARWKAG